MPTLLRWHGYRFFFFSNEGSEPPHVHVDKAGNTAKFWLNPVSLASHQGFSPYALNEISDKVREHQDQFCQTWKDFFYD